MFFILWCDRKQFLCKMSNQADVQPVIETIDSAINARFQLSHLLDGVSEAKNQVVSVYSFRTVLCIAKFSKCLYTRLAV